MAEKVIVSTEVAKAIEAFKAMQKEKFNISDLDELLSIAADWWAREEFHEFEDLHVVHVLKFIDFCNAFYYGYEVEQSPEELVAKTYWEKRNLCETSNAIKWEHDAYANGIMFTLETLGIKIRGVNE